MKRLTVMTGRAGKALLEIETDGRGAAVRYGGPGELWLFDGQGNCTREKRPPFVPVGAIAAGEGEILLAGGFAGKRELMERARAEVLLRCQKRPDGSKAPGPDKAEGPGQPMGRAPQSRALLEILQKAAELFPADAAEVLPPQDGEGTEGREDAVNPFPEAFPFSRWRRVAYPGTDRYYLEGEARIQGGSYRIHALPGEYRPGKRPRGFDRFLRARDGSGYWVRVSREG